MRLLTTIQTFFSKNKINFLYAFFFVATFLFMSDSAFAGDAPKTEEEKTVQTIQLFFQFLAVIMALMTNLIGWFLSPEWTSGDLIGISGMMKNIWIYVSNIVYFVFAMLFVWIALMNIIGKDGDNYKLKQAIPKFIVGVLIVPFSWFIVQFVISLSSVLTVGVLSIPYNDFQADLKDSKGEAFQVEVCPNGYKISTTSAQKDAENQTDKFVVECNAGAPVEGKAFSGQAQAKQKIALGELLADPKNAPFGLMYFYTYSVMKIDSADKIFSGDITSGITDLVGIIFKYGFAIVIFVVYALLLLALGFALFVRIIWLWMFAMLSPIFGLLYFFDKKEGAGDGAMKNFSIKELISLALVPVYVAAALSFGFLFMKVADTGFKGGVKDEKTDVIKDCFVPLNIAQFTVCWDGSHLNSKGESTTDGSNNSLFDGTLGTILGQFFALIFLWIAVMAALKSSSITKEVVAPIAQFGESIGQIIQKGPANIPIIPVPDGKGGVTGMSASGLSRVGSQASTFVQNASDSTGTNFLKNNGLFGQGVQASIASKEALNYLKNLKGIDTQGLNMYNKAVREFKDTDSIRNNQDAKEMIQNLAGKFEIKDIDVNSTKGIAKALHDIHNASIDKGYRGISIFGDGKLASHEEGYIEGLMGGEGNARTTTGTAGQAPISGVTRNGNNVTINHFSGKDGVNPINITVTDNKADVDNFVRDIQKPELEYVGKISEGELLDKLNGIENKQDIINTLKNINGFFRNTNQ